MGERPAAGAQGWNVDYLAPGLQRGRQYAPSGDGTSVTSRIGRLARCWVLRARASSSTSGRLSRLDLTASEPAHLRLGRWRVRIRPFLENYTVDASIFVAQVFKGTRWMPWHQEPKKDVGICDKPRGVDNQTVIRGFPNGETRLEASPVTPT